MQDSELQQFKVEFIQYEALIGIWQVLLLCCVNVCFMCVRACVRVFVFKEMSSGKRIFQLERKKMSLCS